MLILSISRRRKYPAAAGTVWIETRGYPHFEQIII
jgi:hypothetical protein